MGLNEFLNPPPCKLSVLPRHSTVTWPGCKLGPLYLESSRLTVWCHCVFHRHKAGAYFICLWFSNVSHNTCCNCFTLQLQFLFELPSRLNKCVEMKQYGLAVRYYEFCMTIVFSDKSGRCAYQLSDILLSFSLFFCITDIIQKLEMSCTITVTCHPSMAFTKTVMK